MNNIYIVGDLHGGIGNEMDKVNPEYLKREGIVLDNTDLLLQLGDWGFPFLDKDHMTSEQRDEYYKAMQFWKDYPCEVAFLEGNHDCFSFWSKVPVTQRYSGLVQEHPDSPGVFHLMRGETYKINNLSVFACGGAVSRDKGRRTPNISWWEEEQMTEEEIARAVANLRRYRGKVDLVITHTPPASICKRILYANGDYNVVYDRGADFFDCLMHGDLKQEINFEYRLWCCGHLHCDRMLIPERMIVAYNKIYNVNQMLNLLDICEMK